MDSLIQAGLKVQRIDLFDYLTRHSGLIEVTRESLPDIKGKKLKRRQRRIQLPWSKNLFIFYHDNKISLLDLATNTIHDQMFYSQLESIERFILDIQHHRIGVLTATNKLRIYKVDSLKIDQLEEYDISWLATSRLFPQFYDKFVLIRSDQGIRWYALDTQKMQREFQMNDDDRWFRRFSTESPTMYVIQMAYGYYIHEIDCTLQAEDRVNGPFMFSVNRANCTDGIIKAKLVEHNGKGLLSTYHLGTFDRCIEYMDMRTRQVKSWFSEYELQGFSKVRFWPDGEFYSLTKNDYNDRTVFTVDYMVKVFKRIDAEQNNVHDVSEADEENEVLNGDSCADQSNENSDEVEDRNDESSEHAEEDIGIAENDNGVTLNDDDQQIKASNDNMDFHEPNISNEVTDPDDEDVDPDFKPDPNAYFSQAFKGFQIKNSKWLTNDIIVFKMRHCSNTYSSQCMPTKNRLMFFSVSQRKMIGFIEDDIDSVHMMYDSVACINSACQIYIVHLNSIKSIDSNGTKRKLSDSTDENSRTKRVKLN